MKIRKIIKRSIPEKARYFLRLDNYRDLFFYSSILFKRVLCFYLSFPFRYPLSQVIQTIHPKLNFLKENNFNIALSLHESGFSFQEGRHCIYLSDKNDLVRLLGDVLSDYPKKIGLKIVKSREISPDGTPFYTSSRNAPASNYITTRAVGSLLEKAIISNILSLSGFAPRVYDVICLGLAECHFFGFVVQHIDGDQVRGKEGLDFMDSFRRILKKEQITIVAAKRNKDLKPPDFNHNIYSFMGHGVYIDIQNFAIFNKKEYYYPVHFLKRFDVGSHSTATSPNPKRYFSFQERWVFKNNLMKFAKILDLFIAEQNIDLKEQVVFDMGDPAGLFTSIALSLGAFWSYIFTQNEEKIKTKRFLFENGFSRFQLNHMSNQSDFEKIINEIKILFYNVNYSSDSLIRLVQSNRIQNLLLDFNHVKSSTIRKREISHQLHEIGYIRTEISSSFDEDINMMFFSKKSSTV